MTTETLVSKYNVPAPRYTSYPTVPYWDNEPPTPDAWLERVKATFRDSNGISLYIHLPYCESLCTYCGCNTRITTNHNVEDPYIDSLLREWRLYLAHIGDQPLISEVHLGGGTPTFFAPRNLKRLIEGIRADSRMVAGAELSFEGHPRNTTREHLQVLRELGFSRVSFGIQDFDPRVQEIINRIQTTEDVERVTSESRALGYESVNYDLVYGLPLQTMESVEASIRKVIEFKPDRIAFYSYAHVPWIKGSQRRFTEDDLPDEHTKLALYLMGSQMLREAGYIDIGMDHFALPEDSLNIALKQGRLHRNFMGYTTNNTRLLIALGVSSISDSYTAFVQNHKVVEKYMAAVNAGELAIFKGHLLNDEDLAIRRHILNLICRYETQWEGETPPYLTEALRRMRELESDGLVITDARSIRVTELGRRFIRNICLCLDARYWRAVPEKQIFSSAV